MKRFAQILLSGMLCAAAFSFPAFANQNEPNTLGRYSKEVPGIGLVADSVQFDGITISNFRFDDGKKYVFVKPGEKFRAHMHYVIDASHLKTLDRHHLIIGLHKDGPQTCVLHSLGIKNSEGDASVVLQAPDRRGVYQVRFAHTIGVTDEQAHKQWWRGEGPSAKTIMGIVIVE